MKRSPVKINNFSMVRGKFKVDGNNKIAQANGGVKAGEMFAMEFAINQTPPNARTLLTKGYIQDEINAFSGATVSTRGRFMTEQEKARCPHERPLYLYIQGHSMHNVDLAVQKINEIIKTEHNKNSTNRPTRFTNAPPPLLNVQSGISSAEKIFVGIENVPGFDLREKIIGDGGSNLMYIKTETGATVTLRGNGSRFVEASLRTESPEPLHLYIEYSSPAVLQKAKELAINLIQTIQSELQSFMQSRTQLGQNPQIMQQQQMQQAQFQAMNIGPLGQSNVVTIQHHDIIQHPHSSVVTLPATIVTASVPGAPNPPTPMPPPGVHGPPHPGIIPSNEHTQEMQTFVSPPPGNQMQIIGSPAISQVQYQIHTSQQPMTQMYVMSQPPPQAPMQQNFLTSSAGAPMANTVSYVYTQPNVQRPPTPYPGLPNVVETINLQHPPPPSDGVARAATPPPLLHLHFPPPFIPNQPPPPISQTYQIQYQQVQPESSQEQFILQPGQQLQQANHDGRIHQFEPPQAQQIQVHGPPPSNQNYVEHPENLREHEPPQPVPPPPQMVPPPGVVNQVQPMGVVPNVPPPTHGPPPPLHQTPWLFQGPEPGMAFAPPPQGQIQIPPPNMVTGEMQPRMQFEAPPMRYQNGKMQHQAHFAGPPPIVHHHGFEQKPEVGKHQKPHGVKRKFHDIEELQQKPPTHSSGWPSIKRHGTGETDRAQQNLQGLGPSSGPVHRDPNKMFVPTPHPGEKRFADRRMVPGQNNLEREPGEDSGNNDGMPLLSLGPMSQNEHHPGISWNRPPPAFNERLGQHVGHQMPPPVNMPPPHINFLRGQADELDGPPGQKPFPLSICNPPPPPPVPQGMQRHQTPVMQNYQHPPWVN